MSTVVENAMFMIKNTVSQRCPTFVTFTSHLNESPQINLTSF